MDEHTVLLLLIVGLQLISIAISLSEWLYRDLVGQGKNYRSGVRWFYDAEKRRYVRPQEMDHLTKEQIETLAKDQFGRTR